MSNIQVQEQTWSQIRDTIASIDPNFTQVLDDWDPGKEYTFTALSYPFGTHVLDVNNHGFQVPTTAGHTLPLTDPSVPTELQKKLGYSSIPVGFITHNALEVYHKLDECHGESSYKFNRFYSCHTYGMRVHTVNVLFIKQ